MAADNWDRSYQITSIFSVVGSCLVVLTLLLFKSMQSKLFMQIIANISMADLLGNIEYTTLYRPSDDAPWCSIQGFLNLYAYPCSWLWTTVLVRFLYDLAVFKEIRMSFRAAFFFCWGFPLIPTLLVFAFVQHGTYTRRSGEPNSSFCSYGGKHEGAFIWHNITYYGLLLVCVAYMGYLYVLIRRAFIAEAQNVANINAQSQHGRHTENTQNGRHTENGRESGTTNYTSSTANLNGMKLTADSLLLNPLIMVVLWMPHIVVVVLSISVTDITQAQFRGVGVIMKILHGFFTSLLFFARSQGARTLWIRLLCCRYKFVKTVAEEVDEEDLCRDSDNRISDYRITNSFRTSAAPSMASLATVNPLSIQMARVVTNAEIQV